MNGSETQPRSEGWIMACRVDEVELEDVLRFDHEGRTFVIIRSPDDKFFAMDGHCSHEKIHLADGLVDEFEIECPMHAGTFDYRTGEARNLPACIDLKTFPVRVEGGEVFVQV